MGFNSGFKGLISLFFFFEVLQLSSKKFSDTPRVVPNILNYCAIFTVYIIFTNLAASRMIQHGGWRLGHLSYRRCPGRDSSRASSNCICRAIEHCILQVGSGWLGSVLRHLCRWHQVSTRPLCRGVKRDEVKGEYSAREVQKCAECSSGILCSREEGTVDVRTAEQFWRISLLFDVYMSYVWVSCCKNVTSQRYQKLLPEIVTSLHCCLEHVWCITWHADSRKR